MGEDRRDWPPEIESEEDAQAWADAQPDDLQRERMEEESEELTREDIPGDAASQAVIDALQREGKLTIEELADRVDRELWATRRTVIDLYHAGVVEGAQSGRDIRLSTDAQQVLESPEE